MMPSLSFRLVMAVSQRLLLSAAAHVVLLHEEITFCRAAEAEEARSVALASCACCSEARRAARSRTKPAYLHSQTPSTQIGHASLASASRRSKR